MATENGEVFGTEVPLENKSIGKIKKAAGSGYTLFGSKKPTFNPKLLAVGGGILLLGSAFVIASLYLPPNLTLKFMESMQALSPTFFYMVLGSGIVGAGIGAGSLYLAQKPVKFNKTLRGDDNTSLDMDSDEDSTIDKTKVVEVDTSFNPFILGSESGEVDKSSSRVVQKDGTGGSTLIDADDVHDDVHDDGLISSL